MAEVIGVTARLFAIAGFLFAGIYSLILLIRKSLPGYFKVSLLGIFTMLLARLFFLVLNLSGGNDSGFSAGVLGQAASFLFFISANAAFLPERKERYRLDIPAFMTSLLPMLAFITVAAMKHTVSGILYEGIYLICLCPTAYISARAIRERRYNRFSAAVAPFNFCVCLLVYMKAVNHLLLWFRPAGLLLYQVILAVLLGIVIAIMMPLLEKGVSAWKVS